MPAFHAATVLRRALATALFNAVIALFITAVSGDDVYGEDPSVNRLEAELAKRLGFAESPSDDDPGLVHIELPLQTTGAQEP